RTKTPPAVAPRAAVRACVAGATLGVVVAVATQTVQASTDVSKEQWSYPWWSGASIGFWLVPRLLHAVLLVGLSGRRRCGAAGNTRTARGGLTAALVGAGLI